MSESKIDTIIRIGNDLDFMKQIEPGLMWHQHLERWMVKRVLIALERMENDNGTNRS